MQDPINEILKQITCAEENIINAEEAKTDLVDSLMKEVTANCELFADLWQKSEMDIKARLELIGSKYDYKFPYTGYLLSKDYYLEKIANNFPIHNNVNNFIVDELPRTNSQWTFENKSNGADTILEVTPLHLLERYPTDPEDNPYAFTYKIPKHLCSFVHQGATEEEINQHKENISAFFHTTVEKELVDIEATIKEKVELISNKLNGIDFSDPLVVNELKKKMKLL